MESLFSVIIAKKAPSLPFELPSTTTTNTNTNTTAANWANLPTNILLGLIKYLDLKADITRLRAVCPSWRSALSLSLLPSPSSAFTEMPEFQLHPTRQPVFLRPLHFYLLSKPNQTHPSNSWLVRLTPLTTNYFHLFNPMNFDRYITPIPRVSGEISLLDCNVLELSSSVCVVGGGQHPYDYKVNKVLSKKGVGGWNFLSPNVLNAFASLILLTKENGGGLFFLRIGDLEWNKIEQNDTSYNFVDVAFYDGEFYAFEKSKWKVGIIDPDYHDLMEPPSIDYIDAPDLDLDVSLYLVIPHFVPTKDRLYLVIEVIRRNTLMVFVLDEKEWEWNRVKSIGDEVFFIGSDVSFAVSSNRLPGWKPGSICLFDEPVRTLYEQHVKALGDAMPEGVEFMDAIFFFIDMSHEGGTKYKEGEGGFEPVTCSQHLNRPRHPWFYGCHYLC